MFRSFLFIRIWQQVDKPQTKILRDLYSTDIKWKYVWTSLPFLHAEKPLLAFWEPCKFYKHRVLLTGSSRPRACTAPPLGCSPPAEQKCSVLCAGTAPRAEQKERRKSKLHSQQGLHCLQQKIRPLTKIFKLEQNSVDYTKPSSCLDSWVSDMVYWCENIASSESSRICLFVCFYVWISLLNYCSVTCHVEFPECSNTLADHNTLVYAAVTSGDLMSILTFSKVKS